jgi:hypothetical protein
MRKNSQGSSQDNVVECRFDRGALHQNYAQKNKKELRVEEFTGFRVDMRRGILTLKLHNSLTPKLNSLEENYA